jgi:transaldolase
MPQDPLRRLQALGQSVWLDFLSRPLIHSGQLQRRIEEDGLSGLTSNPAIFEKAFSSSDEYDQEIGELARKGLSAKEIYETLAVGDVQQACDLLRPVYDGTQGRDGYVSLEVSPHLAHDATNTVAEALRLAAAVDRANLLVKVPGTREGIGAIGHLLGLGIGVNITLLFGLPRYREVAETYLAVLEDRVRDGRPVDHVASVASFFLSRMDVLLDPQLERIAEGGGPNAALARSLAGKVAVANAKAAYAIFRELFRGERFGRLADHGARPQRLLWASTSTKNPRYRDVMYVEPLIGPETINTMPQETLDAYRDHGDPAPRLEQDLAQSQQLLQRLAELGIDRDQLARQLEEEGLEKFNKPFDKLLATLEAKRVAALQAESAHR